MRMPSGVQRIGNHHGVIDRRKNFDAGTVQHLDAEFGIMQNFQNRGIRQQRPQRLQNLAYRQLRGVIQAELMPNRNIPALPGAVTSAIRSGWN